MKKNEVVNISLLPNHEQKMGCRQHREDKMITFKDIWLSKDNVRGVFPENNMAQFPQPGVKIHGILPQLV